MEHAIEGPFRLTRWFALLSWGSIGLISVLSAILLSRFFIGQMLHRDGVVTMQFVQSLMRNEHSKPFFLSRTKRHAALKELAPTDAAAGLRKLFAQIASMPDVIHVNVYDVEQRVIWSSNPAAIGRQPGANEELEEALQGELVVGSDIIEGVRYLKPEHMFLRDTSEQFVENYIPVHGADNEAVLGVVEIYKSPNPLFKAVYDLTRWIWISAIASGLFLFVVLLSIVRRADSIIRGRQRRLVASESLSAVGEMAAAVAQGIRNPLASIRSSAGLLMDTDGGAREQAEDIVTEIDRIEGWVRDLLTYTQQGSGRLARLQLNRVIESAMAGFQRKMERLDVAPELRLTKDLPEISGDLGLLAQILNSLIANALEAMPNGGRLTIETSASGDKHGIDVKITDTGVGITPEQIDKLFVPFHTTRKGLGAGLALVTRTVERLGGTVDVWSQPGEGTVVTVRIPLE